MCGSAATFTLVSLRRRCRRSATKDPTAEMAEMTKAPADTRRAFCASVLATRGRYQARTGRLEMWLSRSHFAEGATHGPSWPPLGAPTFRLALRHHVPETTAPCVEALKVRQALT